jgi:hypothetical protein
MLYNVEYLTQGGSIGIYGRSGGPSTCSCASTPASTPTPRTSSPPSRWAKDLDGACLSDPTTAAWTSYNHSNEISPNFDFRYDMPGPALPLQAR